MPIPFVANLPASSGNYYAIIFSPVAEKAWNHTLGQWEGYANANYADYAIDVNAGTNIESDLRLNYPDPSERPDEAAFANSSVPAAPFVIQYRTRAGSTPATSDTIIETDKYFYPQGNVIGTGGNKITVTVTSDATPVSDVRLFLTFDTAGSNVISGPILTNGSGQSIFYVGDTTPIYLFAVKTGFNPVVAQSVTITGSGTAQSVSVSLTAASSPSGASGRYCVQADLERMFGSVNIARWSNTDNTTTTAVVDNIQRAIDDAESALDDFFRSTGRYVVPLSVRSGTTVRNWAATLSGIYLYRARGTNDNGERFDGLEAQTWDTAALYRSGDRKLDAEEYRASYESTGPVGIL